MVKIRYVHATGYNVLCPVYVRRGAGQAKLFYDFYGLSI